MVPLDAGKQLDGGQLSKKKWPLENNPSVESAAELFLRARPIKHLFFFYQNKQPKDKSSFTVSHFIPTPTVATIQKVSRSALNESGRSDA